MVSRETTTYQYLIKSSKIKTKVGLIKKYGLSQRI